MFPTLADERRRWKKYKRLIKKHTLIKSHNINNVMYKRVSLSLNDELVDMIDKERGDVTRSRFLQKLIERTYGRKKKQ